MKKLIFSLIMVFIIVFVMTSCGNRNYWDWEHDTYNYVHYIPENKCYAITSWKNNEIGIKVETKEYGILYFSEGTYILIGNKCPICNH